MLIKKLINVEGKRKDESFGLVLSAKVGPCEDPRALEFVSLRGPGAGLPYGRGSQRGVRLRTADTRPSSPRGRVAAASIRDPVSAVALSDDQVGET